MSGWFIAAALVVGTLAVGAYGWLLYRLVSPIWIDLDRDFHELEVRRQHIERLKFMMGDPHRMNRTMGRKP